MIAIKSQTNNRLRVKSKYFTKEFLDSLSFDDEVYTLRANAKCKSLVLYFDESKTNTKELIDYLTSLLPKNFCKPTKEKNLSCSGVACSVCHPQTDLKKSAFSFGVLSIYALGVFTPIALPPALTLGVSLFAATPLLKEAWRDIKKRKFTLQTFMSFSLIGAALLGEAETAFEVIYILRGGMLLEEYAANRSKAKVHELLNADIKKAYVLIDELEVEVNLEDVKTGDIVVVRSGEKIPVDGEITKGKAEISEALINGRSEPSFKEAGDKVFSNTLVQKGRIFIRTDATGSKTYLAKITDQVEYALSNRSQSEKQADKLASKLLNLGTFLTAGTFLLTGSALRAFSVMIVMSCPCATILAASTAVSAGIAKAAKEGILIKGGEYLEKFSQSDVICFDKTGTLTTGKPQIVDIVLNNSSEKELFKTASLAEYRNTHPLALCILEHAEKLGIKAESKTNSELLVGLGAKLKLDNETILVGNKKLMDLNKISTKNFDTLKYTNDGLSVVYVAKNKNILGLIAFSHEQRDGVKSVVNDLKKRGVKKIILLTGDDEKVGKSFAKQFGFDEVYANLMPDEKAKVIEELKKEYKIVSMIGDGINDTIAMGKSDVGVSFASGGSEAAVELSDIAIINSDIQDVLTLHDISSFSLKVVNQNYWIGTSTNLIGVGFASVGMLSPVAAGGLHLAHTVGIMANASRIALKNNSKDDLSIIDLSDNNS